MPSPKPPAPEFNNSNRLEVITELIQTLNINTQIKVPAWASLWFADINSLRRRIEHVMKLEYIEGTNIARLFLSDWFRVDNTINELINAWMGILEEDERLEKEREKKRDPWRVERPTPPLLNVDECASSRTFEEEQDHEDVDSAQVDYRPSKGNYIPAQITEEQDSVEAYHICPFGQGRDGIPPSDMERHWYVLKYFWPAEKIDSWKKALNSNTSRQRISMSTQAYKLWKDACFALQPVHRSEDGTSLTVRFWWMPPPYKDDWVDPATMPWSNGIESAPGCRELHSIQGKMYFGQEITLQTEDPVKSPLPSWELFEMQWIFHRIAALSGPRLPYEWPDYESND